MSSFLMLSDEDTFAFCFNSIPPPHVLIGYVEALAPVPHKTVQDHHGFQNNKSCALPKHLFGNKDFYHPLHNGGISKFSSNQHTGYDNLSIRHIQAESSCSLSRIHIDSCMATFDTAHNNLVCLYTQ